MPEPKDQRLYLPQLTQYRAAAARRRATAFSGASDYVIGCRVSPLTPAAFSRLYAVGSPFICGGTPTELDVRHYIWMTSPHYCRAIGVTWRIKKLLVMAPFVIALGGWRRLLLMRPSVPHYLLQLARAIGDINSIIERAFADSPPASGRPGKPIATLEAFFVHEFAVAYRWTPERTSNTPIRELIQLHRCIRSARGEEIADEGEENILAEHLKRRNAEAAAQRKAATNG